MLSINESSGCNDDFSTALSKTVKTIGNDVSWSLTSVPGNYEPGMRILRSAQFLRSATVNRSRKGFALIIFSRLVRPGESAVVTTRTAAAAVNGNMIDP